MTRALAAVLFVLGAAAADDPKPAAGETKPPYERLLKGEEAKKAIALEKRMADLEETDDYEGAVKAAEELLALRVRVQGADHWEAATANSDAWRLKALAARPAAARRAWREARRDVAAAIGHYEKGEFAKAEPGCRRYVDACRQLLGGDHPDTAQGLNNLARLYQAQSRHADAEPLYRDALRICRAALGDAHPNTAASLNNLALLYRAQGRHTAAEPLLKDALRVWRAALGGDHPDTVATLGNLALLYRAQGRHADAEPLLKDALRIRRAALGGDHPDTALSLGNLAGLYRAQGRYADAEPLYRDALRVCRAALGDAHPYTVTTLSNLAVLYLDQGRHADAEPLLQDTLRVTRAALGNAHPDTAASLNNLALLYHAQAKYADAEPLLKDALRVTRLALRGDHPLIAQALSNLAGLYRDQGRYADAEPLLQDALRIKRAALGDSHPSTAISLSNLALLYRAQAKYADAEPLLQDALRVWRAALGDAHPSIAQALSALAGLYLDQGRYVDAEPLLQDAARSYEAARLARAAAAERGVGVAGFDPYPALAAVAAARGKPAEAYRAAEAGAARGLLDARSSRRGAGLTSDEEMARAAAAARLAAVDARLLGLVTQPKPTEAERAERDALGTDRQKLTDELAALAAAASRREVVDLPDIKTALPADAALVLWVDAAAGAGQVGNHWGCVVRSAGTPAWEPLPGSGPDRSWTKVDSALPARFADALAGGATAAEVGDLAKKLHAQRLAPLEKHLAGVTRLYVVANGAIARVPVEALTDRFTVSYTPSGTVLARLRAAAKPAWTGLLAVGDPVYPPAPAPAAPPPLPPGGLLVLQVVPGSAAADARVQAGDVILSYAGTPINDLDAIKKLVADHEKDAKPVPAVLWREGQEKTTTRDLKPGKLGVVFHPDPAPRAVAGRRQTDATLARLARGGDWTELPGTAAEVARLAELFGEKAKTLTRSDASEQRLEALRAAGDLGKYRYLHFAAHGQANDARAFDSALILARDKLPPDGYVAKAGERYIDGKLTADEVLREWRLDAELVTLSACETALGRDGGGDGLLGFAQAFLHAGSRAVCLSLWKVDDAATALLMDRFYQNLLGKREGLAKPMGKAAALAEAKAWLRNLSAGEAVKRSADLAGGVARGKGDTAVVLAPPTAPGGGPAARPFAHPRYWAAFVLVGDPD